MSIRLFSKISISVMFISIFSTAGGKHFAVAADFEEFKRGHFVVHHNNRSLANKVSWKAEYHYKRIVNNFGVKEFRPWEGRDKCAIYLYKTKSDYVKATGAPEWSTGLAQYQLFRFSSYENAPDFLEDTLPHEMTHMLFHLFMDKKHIPLWLNEGMAQFEEVKQSSIYQRKRLIKWHVQEKSYIKLNELLKTRTVPEDKINLFYAESASLVDHLITDNIRASFGRFLTRIKDGDTVEDALKKSYQWKYKNGISDLEDRWLVFVNRKY